MENRQKSVRVCVTGASGWIGSWLVKMLLHNGYTVHATLRNLGDSSKVGVLKSLPKAEANLFLFKVDLYKSSAKDFDEAINGCDFVFHVATPMAHDSSQSSQYGDMSEAAVAGVRLISEACIRSKTVKRLVYTASIVSTSRLTDDGIGIRSCIDESSWTPLDSSLNHHPDFYVNYTRSKTLSEKAILSYNEMEKCNLEVVTLACGVVGGDTLLPHLSDTSKVICSIISGDSDQYKLLKCVEEVTGSIPLVHIKDVCRAHLFCIEKHSSMKGRFLCGVANPTFKGIALYFRDHILECNIPKELMEGEEEGVAYDFQKLVKMGFEYKYDMKKALDETIACGKRFGVI